jgi:mannosyl-3-phosphoglycerate phosphatase
MTIDWRPRALHAAVWRRTANQRRTTQSASRRIVVFADPDTLRNHSASSLSATRDTLNALAGHGVVVVLWGDESRAELELIQQDLSIPHPFISENGGGLFLPSGYFARLPYDARATAGYAVIDFGRPYHHVADVLHEVADRLGVQVTSFRDLSINQVAEQFQLSLPQALRAKLREYDEPFRIASADQAVQSRLFTSLRRAGLRCFAQEHYHHATGVTDKAESIRTLTALYRQIVTEVVTVGLARDPFETCLLQAVDIPVVIHSDSIDVARLLSKVPTARLVNSDDCCGWSEIIWWLVHTSFSRSVAMTTPRISTALGRSTAYSRSPRHRRG